MFSHARTVIFALGMGLGLSLFASSGCEDDPMDLDYLQEPDAATGDAGGGAGAGGSAAGSGAAGEGDGGTDDAGADDAG